MTKIRCRRCNHQIYATESVNGYCSECAELLGFFDINMRKEKNEKRKTNRS